MTIAGRLALLVLIALVAAPTVEPASAQAADEGATGITRVVSDGPEYRQAIEDLSADHSGPHRIVFAGDVHVGSERLPFYTGDQDLTLVGNGHRLSGGSTELLVGQVIGPVLRIEDLTLRGAAGGVLWFGTIIVRGSTFVRLGRGYPANQAGSAIYAPTGGGVLSRVDVRDSRFIDNRSRGPVIDSVGYLHATRITMFGNDAYLGLIRARNRMRITDSRIARNLARGGPVLFNDRSSLELIDTRVVNNSGLAQRWSTVESRVEVRLVRALIQGNRTSGNGVAVETDVLVARSAVVRHATRACRVHDHTEATDSIASDPSCGF